jgi:PleD family two-component response regulator
MPDTTRSLDNLAAQADAALMEAKRLGRNRVETARPLA